MTNTFLIEVKKSGSFGSSETRVVVGTHVTIERGHLHVWNARLEGPLGKRPTTSVALDRVVMMKSKENAPAPAVEAHGLTELRRDAVA